MQMTAESRRAAMPVSDALRPLVELSDARARRDDYGLAEPGAEQGRWYALVTHPNHEGIAAAHLIGRRFGTYLPQYRPDGPKGTLRTLFPGYLFVFAWGIERHQRRILSVPGAVTFLAETVAAHDDRGRIVHADRPAAIPDGVMKAISLLEDRLMLATMPRSYRRKRRGAADVVSISVYSALEGTEALDDTARSGILRRALGLGSST